MNLEKQILKRLVKTLLSIFLSLPLGHFLQSGSLCIAFVCVGAQSIIIPETPNGVF